MRITIGVDKTVALSPPAHAPTEVDIIFLASVGVSFTATGGAIVARVPGWVRYFR